MALSSKRGNNGWEGKIQDFISTVESQVDSFDIFSFKFCYLDGLDELAEPCGKPFGETKTEQNWQLLKNAYETLEQRYPNKVFIWWTLPLTQVGQYCTEQMNKRIREYCRNNGKILFDLADIQSWDTLGNNNTNSQGWEITFKGFCGEQNPDSKSCHPNWLGSVCIGKAFWFLISDIARKISSVYIENPNSFSIYELSFLFPRFSEINPWFEIQIFKILGSFVYQQNPANGNLNELPRLHQGFYLLKILTQYKRLLFYTFIN